MFKKLSPLLLLLVLASCEDNVESCSDEFLSDYNTMKSSFKISVQKNADISKRSKLKESLDSFLAGHKEVKCSFEGKQLDPTTEVKTLLSDLSASTVFTPEVVYGDDNRVDVEDSTNENYIKWAKATAAQIRAVDINDDYTMSPETLGQSLNLCKGERFSDQINPARCSGFLVAPDLLVTAGHCMETNFDCEEKRWVFDFVKGTRTLNPENIYKCVEIISQKLDANTEEDYAVVRLERAVSGRSHLSFRTKGKVEKSQSLVVIGHPSGLPTKIADGAKVRSNNKSSFFVANLDTFGGNSGSAVLDAKTGLVEGILVRGEDDYKYIDNGAGGYCRVVNVCKEDECRGEDVTRMTVVKGLPEQVILDPNEVLDELFSDDKLEKENNSGLISFYFKTNKEKVVSGRKFLDVCTLHTTDVSTPKSWSEDFTGSCDDQSIEKIIKSFVE